jgi:hypothetical protein
MKILTEKHFQKLDKLKLEQYLDRCVSDLEEIAFINPFPRDKETYPEFVSHVYEVAKAYGLENHKHAFSLMLAWHVRGENFIREERIISLLQDPNIDAFTKSQILTGIAKETMEAYEAQQGEENDI